MAGVGASTGVQLLGVAVAAAVLGCAPADDPTPSAADPAGAGPSPCDLLETVEVEGLVGEAVHEGRESELGPTPMRSTCLWGDVDPTVPGHVVLLSLTHAATADDDEPRADDVVYELDDLGDHGVGIERSGGGVLVRFTVRETRVELSYDVLPPTYARDHTIDRVIRLARRVEARIDAHNA